MATRNSKKIQLIKGRRLRVTRVDSCGRVVYGDGSVVTSKGFISVALSANTSDSDEINLQNAAGESIVFEASVTSLTGYGVEISMGEVDPELAEIVAASVEKVLDKDGNAAGIDIDLSADPTGEGFALEVWAGAPVGDACDDEAAEGSYGYILLPFLMGGILGDFTIENDAVTFTLTGAQTKSGNAWGKGPYDVQLQADSTPGPLLKAVKPTLGVRLVLVDVAPPEALNGARPLLNPSATKLTGVTSAVSGKVATLTFAPAGAVTSGVYVDFGDGTWDYVTTATTTHTYDTAGTYSAQASTTGDLVSTNVVIAS